jgi:hypothetical protein
MKFKFWDAEDWFFAERDFKEEDAVAFCKEHGCTYGLVTKQNDRGLDEFHNDSEKKRKANLGDTKDEL